MDKGLPHHRRQSRLVHPGVDDLDAPLGLDRPAAPARRLPWKGLAAALALAVAAGAGAYVWQSPDPFPGGRAVAVARIETVTPEPAAPVESVPAGTSRRAQAGANEIEAESGVQVYRPGGAAPPGALIIKVPEALRVRLNPAPDPRLVERSPKGDLPKIGADGTRPSEVYGRPLVTPASLRAGAPRIALVVGGLGLNPVLTADAIDKLPPDVTLGFAASGSQLARDAARAREEGHEILLQVPMEPLTSGGDMPGMLRVSETPAANIDRLRTAMARFPGYVGVTNYLGQRFTAEMGAFAPVLREIAGRGLIFMDEGSSPRSLTAAIAKGAQIPALRADVALDVARPGGIEAGLSELEALARKQGFAIGSATALPPMLDALQRWSAGLEGRGIALVPLTALVQRGSIAARQDAP